MIWDGRVEKQPQYRFIYRRQSESQETPEASEMSRDIDIEIELMYGSGLEDTASATQSVSNFGMLLF